MLEAVGLSAVALGALQDLDTILPSPRPRQWFAISLEEVETKPDTLVEGRSGGITGAEHPSLDGWERGSAGSGMAAGGQQRLGLATRLC